MNQLGQDDVTSAWLLTPVGASALAVIAVTGPQAESIVRQVFVPRSTLSEKAVAGAISFGRLRDGSGEIDEALVAFVETGDRGFVEINTHGSTRVVQRVLRRLEELGASIGGARVGHGPSPWAGSDRLECDLSETLSRCVTRRAVRLACAASSALRSWLSGLPAHANPSQADSIERECLALLGSYESNRFLFDGVRVALVGAPNAGKSTLANRLFDRQAALESPEPGTTRDWVEEPASLGGVPLILADTAGLRAPGEPLEHEAIHRGLARSAQADVRFFMADVHADLSPEAAAWLESVREDPRTILIVNKIDSAPGVGASFSPPETWERRCVRLSARTGEGLDRLAAMLSGILGISPITESKPDLICHRQAESVRSALARWKEDESLAAGRLAADILVAPGIESQ